MGGAPASGPVGAPGGPPTLPTMARAVTRRQLAAALAAIDAAGPEPDRATTAEAVRASLRWLAQQHPGKAVEIRVPPFAAVQAIGGLSHTRGTPPNVVETDPVTWIGLVTGAVAWDDALAGGRVTASGTRADLSSLLPLADRTTGDGIDHPSGPRG